MKFVNKSENGNPFIERIIFEEKLFENNHFCIVKDADPVAPGHLLLFTKESATCLADFDLFELDKFLNNFMEIYAKYSKIHSFSLFERGRASFCSSFAGIKHAHAHLLPNLAANENYFKGGPVRIFSNLKEALKSVSKDSEYLLWGNIEGKYYLISPFSSNIKRIIRKTIEQCYA